MKFFIGERVYWKQKRGIIADHLNGTYLLWDHTGKKELSLHWIPESEISRGDWK